MLPRMEGVMLRHRLLILMLTTTFFACDSPFFIPFSNCQPRPKMTTGCQRGDEIAETEHKTIEEKSLLVLQWGLRNSMIT